MWINSGCVYWPQNDFVWFTRSVKMFYFGKLQSLTACSITATIVRSVEE